MVINISLVEVAVGSRFTWSYDPLEESSKAFGRPQGHGGPDGGDEAAFFEYYFPAIPKIRGDDFKGNLPIHGISFSRMAIQS